MSPPGEPQAPTGRLPLQWFGPVFLLLVVAQVAWFLWFSTVPIPEASSGAAMMAAGDQAPEPVRRWHLYALALPGIAPGNTVDQSILARASRNLSHFENLPERIPLAAAGLLITGAGLGLGWGFLRLVGADRFLNRLDSLALAFGTGLTLLSALTLIAGRWGLLAPWPVRIFLGACTTLGLFLRLTAPAPNTNPARRLTRTQLLTLIAIGLPFAGLMVLGSFMPSTEFDALEYHLQGPREWFELGKIQFLPHNVYTTMPFSIEMLHLLGMELTADWWRGALVGQFVIMLHGFLATLCVALLAARLGGNWCAVIAALIYLSTPWIYRLSVYAFVEGPLGYYHAALMLAIERAWNASQTGEPAMQAPRRVQLGLWCLVGALAGGAFDCKYPALISAVIPAGVLALAAGISTRRFPSVPAAFAAGLILTTGPWLAKNLIDHRNPVYPLGYSVFGGQPWDAQREAQWKNAHGPRTVSAPELVRGVLNVAGQNDWQSPLYLALAPLALLRRIPRRAIWLLMGFCLYLFATWWLLTHRIDRFWLPMLPAFAILAGLGATWTARAEWRFALACIMALGLASNWVLDVSDLAGLNQWTDSLEQLEADAPRLSGPGLSWLDEHLPEHSQTLLVGPAAVFHMKHKVLYNTVFDKDRLEELARGKTSAEFLAALHDNGITHIYIDWSEIERHRKPGGYGFSSFVRPSVLGRWVREGVLVPDRSRMPVPNKELYRVAPVGGAGTGLRS